MSEFIDYLLTTEYGPYVMIFITVCYVLSHVVQYLPVSWTEKIPNWIMVLINLAASKHGAEEAAKTDIKGNSK